MWSTSRPNEALSSTLLTFFDTVAQAKKMYHDFYTKSDPAYRPSFGKAILLKRNAVLDWQPWDTTGGPRGARPRRFDIFDDSSRPEP